MQKVQLYSWLIPLKDNMIDEERAKKEAAGQMTFEQKINLLNDQVSKLYFSGLQVVFVQSAKYFWREDQSSQRPGLSSFDHTYRLQSNQP